MITQVTTSPVSDARFNIELPGGRFSATVRPPNFDELTTAAALAEGPDQKLKLFALCAVDFDPKMPTAPRRSIGQVIHAQLTGDDLTAVEIPEDELSDEAADALVKKRAGNPAKEFVCLVMDEVQYVLFGPEPSLVDGLTAKKAKGGGLALDLAFVERHLFHGDLATLKREKPAGVLELARKMCEIGGVSLRADVKKA